VMNRFVFVFFITFYFLVVSGCDGDKSDPKCVLEPDPGVCNAAITKYYFDKNEKKCKEFTWGGCGGVVPFNTLSECQKECGNK
jgi:hypothetical protein